MITKHTTKQSNQYDDFDEGNVIEPDRVDFSKGRKPEAFKEKISSTEVKDNGNNVKTDVDIKPVNSQNVEAEKEEREQSIKQDQENDESKKIKDEVHNV